MVVLFPKDSCHPQQQQRCWGDNVRARVVARSMTASVSESAFPIPGCSSARESSATAQHVGCCRSRLLRSSSLAVQAALARGVVLDSSGNLGNPRVHLGPAALTAIDRLVLATTPNAPSRLLVTGSRAARQRSDAASAMDVAPEPERLRHLFPGAGVIGGAVSGLGDNEPAARASAPSCAHAVVCPHTRTPRYTPAARAERRRASVLVATAHPAKFREIIDPWRPCPGAGESADLYDCHPLHDIDTP